MKPMRSLRERVSEAEWELRANWPRAIAWWRGTA